ncbi:MAG: hypothetical protein U0694_25650 [Anaerolineae bacterium]
MHELMCSGKCKMMMGLSVQDCGEIQLAEGRLDKQAVAAARAGYGDNGYAINNTAAKLNLYRRSPDTALTHIRNCRKNSP